jgi:RNA polymerase sigma-70 factor (ECF subfamily)
MELVRAERRNEALSLLLPAFRRKVFGLAYSYLRNREAAEDVAQDVFIRIWRALPGFDGRASLSTWIYTITRNASLSALRAQRVRPTLAGEDFAELMDARQAEDGGSNAAHGQNPSGDMMDGAALVDSAALLKLVNQLPDKQRQAVMLFYMQEQSHEEVAAMLAIPVGTVKTLLHRARARLSAAMGAP